MDRVSSYHQSTRRLPPLTQPTLSVAARRAPLGTKAFGLSILNGIGNLMTESFRLRYRVYCIERQFLAAADYPAGLEIDQYDESSVHVGAFDARHQLAGTARVVLPSRGTLPTLSHRPSLVAGPLWSSEARWVEVSRLSVSRRYGRTEHAQSIRPAVDYARGDVLLAVSQAVYLASKRVDATHWLVSIERPLARLLTRNGFPFRQLGPEFDYLGPVAAYSMDLAEFEHIARSGRFPQVADFVTPKQNTDDPGIGRGLAFTPASTAAFTELSPPPA